MRAGLEADEPHANSPSKSRRTWIELATRVPSREFA